MDKILSLRRLATVVICILLLGQMAYAAPVNSTTSLEPSNTNIKTSEAQIVKITIGTVIDGPLNVRQAVGTDQNILGKLYKGEVIKIIKSEKGWHSIVTDRVSGWVHGDYIGDIKSITEEEYKSLLASKSAVANKVIDFAKQQIGKPYAYGANGPSAFDCSGFVKYVLNNSGISVPRTSGAFGNIGTPISIQNVQPGDIITMDTSGANNGTISHVGLYAGNGQMIHASTSARGVVLDNIYSAYYAPRIVNIVRVI